MREASIHITETKLLETLEEIIGKREALKMGLDLSYLANQLLIRSKKYSLSNRKILVSNEKQQRQAEKILKSDLQYNIILAKVIYTVRKGKRHRGIEIIKPSNRSDWTLIKTITALALEFREEFHPKLEVSKAFTIFITQCVERMTNFSLSKIPGMASSIMDAYEAKLNSKADNNSEYTERAVKCYNKHILNMIGQILVDYTTLPEKYKFFIEVAAKCKQLKITPEIYIDSQFEGLKWANGIPDPAQLIGDNANKRLQAYLFENQVQLRDVNKENNQQSVNKLRNILKKK